MVFVSTAEFSTHPDQVYSVHATHKRKGAAEQTATPLYIIDIFPGRQVC